MNILTPGLSFEEAEHRYFLRGEQILGCTGVLKAAGYVDDAWFTEESRLRGTAVHDACWYDDEGDLLPESLDPRIRGYVSAWARFKSEMAFYLDTLTLADGRKVIGAEIMAASLVHRVAARTDRVGFIGRVRPVRAVVEIKTGPPTEATPLQTAGQALTLEESGLPVGRRFGLHLRADGTYDAIQHKDRGDRFKFIDASRSVWRRVREEGWQL